MFSDDNDLSEQERSALAALPRGLTPSDLLEERVVRALKIQGHFSTANKLQKRWAMHVMRIAAAIALFAGGVATGHYVLSRPPVTDAALVKRASVTSSDEQPSSPTRTVKNGETAVAEREMWL